MKAAVTRWPEDGIGIEHGPLVYSLPIKEHWTTKVEDKYTTAEFPSWEAMPASAWNFGLAIDASKLDSEVEVKRRPVAPDQALDPWENPPITIEVPARKIEDWELEADPDNTAQKFTPCLPDLSTSKVSEIVERVSLAPYGSTQLRVTIFPAVRT
jgi:hypothetical protein